MRFNGHFFDDMTIRNKIFAGYVAVILLVVGLALATWGMTSKMHGIFEEVVNQTVPEVVALEAVRNSGLRLIDAINTYAFANALGRVRLYAIPKPLAKETREMQSARDMFADALVDFSSTASADDAGSKQLVRSIAYSARDMLKHPARIAKVVHGNYSVEDILVARARFQDSAVAFRGLIDRAIDWERRNLLANSESLRATIDQSLLLVGGGVLLVVLTSLLGGYLIANRIARPIQRLSSAAVRVGEGDFDTTIEGRSAGGEVGELVGAFREMTGKLRAASEKLTRHERLSMLGQVAGTVSHELRNPLGAIRNSMAVIRQQTATKGLGVERALDRVDRNIERCNGIISDLLEFTRVRDLNRQVTAIDGWLAEILDEHELQPGVELRRAMACGSDVALDKDRFRQVLVNLLDNAAQAMLDQNWEPGAGRPRRITVRTELAGPHVRLSVADTGPGIPEDLRSKIFEPLFTTKNFGVGLGLPTVRQIVEQHGGTIDVDGSPEEGTEFVIWLPRQLATSHGETTDLRVSAA